MWGRLFRFGFTGALSTLIHVMVALILLERAGLTLVLANAGAYVCALLFSYFGHSVWVFQKTPAVNMFLRYSLINILILLIITALSWLAEQYDMNGIITVFVIAGAVPVVSYFLHSRITFSAGGGGR